MSLTIRPAVASHAAALVDLRQLMFDSMGTPPNDSWQADAEAWFADHVVTDADLCVLVADEAGQVVASGLAILQRNPPSPGSRGLSAYVANIATLPSARGQGAATRILDGLLEWAVEQGADRAELHATEVGRPIYEKVGFVDTACPSMRLSLR